MRYNALVKRFIIAMLIKNRGKREAKECKSVLIDNATVCCIFMYFHELG